MPAFARRRHLLRATTALMAVHALPSRAQDAKPPLRVIVPLPAGGVADTSVRFFGEQWTTATRQPVMVDNRPGGSYLIGAQQLLQAPADGNTLLHLNSSMVAAQATFQRFDMLKQMATIGMMGTTPGALFVNASSPINNIKDLLAWLRANPGRLNYGAVTGAVEHLQLINWLRRNNLTGTMVAFKGGPDSMTALAQNEIHMTLSALPLIIPFKGKVKPIAIWTDQRAPMTPEVPTFREQGLGDIPELNYWGSLAAPAGTPAATIAAMNSTMVEVMKVPSLVAKFAAQGMIAKTSSPEVMARIITDELKWITPLAAELNLKG